MGSDKAGTKTPTAILVVVGNEILSGKVRDLNSCRLAAVLHERGIRLLRISVVPDVIDTIAREVTDALASADYVFTSGGVGPTHDDVTIDGVAAALGVGVVEHPLLINMLERAKGRVLEPDEPLRRLCRVPDGAEIVNAEDPFKTTPVLDNVFILPGVPELFENRLPGIMEVLQSGPKIFCAWITVNWQESYIVDVLNAAVQRFPAVEFGSYPQHDERGWFVKLTLESIDFDAMQSAFEFLNRDLPESRILAGQAPK